MLFVAEIGLNHNGNLDLAIEMIRQAKWAGADIVKFQLGWRSAPGEINHIDDEGLGKISNWCEFFDIELMVSIFDHQSFQMAQRFGIRRYKVASRTVASSPDLVREMLSDGKQTFISLGMWESAERPFQDYDNAQYLWCKSIYPTGPQDLQNLPKDFSKAQFFGYSDHSVGIEVCLLSIARGAQLIEKHFTLDKSDNTIRDHCLSATPDEFQYLTRIGRDMYRMISRGV